MGNLFRKKFVLFLVFFVLQAKAQFPADLDTSFNSIEKGYGFGDGASSYVHTSIPLSNGKTLVAGDFIFYNSTRINRIVRINNDGTIDSTFWPGLGTDSYILAMVMQTDGKILIGGNFTTYGSVSSNRIARLNSDGSLDTSFHVGTGANNIVYSLALQNDGKIIVGGAFTTYKGVSKNRIVRLNTDGAIDNSFVIGSGFASVVCSVVIQPDGKIIAGGVFTTYNGTPRSKIARLNTNGSNDATFSPGSGANSTIRSMVLQPDGKLLIGGDFTNYNGTAANYVTRLNTNGALDLTFNTGPGANQSVYSIVLQPDNKIILGGGFSTYNGISSFGVVRLNSNGTFDNLFNVGTGTGSIGVFNCSLQNDGKIIIGGGFYFYNGTYRNKIARINTDGSLDETFNYGTGANTNNTFTTIQAIAIQSDDKLIIGGNFLVYNGVYVNHIARVNSNGSLDSTFNIGSGANDNVYTVAIQPDGKILIGGNFTLYAGVSKPYLTRLNSDGTLDATFNVSGSGINNLVSKIIIQPDGKILVAGNFTFYNGVTRNRVVRLNSDGSLDTGFNPGSGPNSIVLHASLQNDNKVVIVGFFTTVNGLSRNRIARLNADGSLDTGFNVGTGADTYVNTTAIQPDGKILIGGHFTLYNGVATKYIIRLDTNGTIDTTFHGGTRANKPILTILLQPDNKILVGGWLTSYNGTAARGITRLNADGSIDNGFNTSNGTDTVVWATAMQSDGKIIIGGDFISYQNIGRNRLARIHGICGTPSIANTTAASNQSICAGNTTTLSVLGNGIINWYATPSSTTSIGSGPSYITPSLSAGSYTFYVEANICTYTPRMAIAVDAIAFPTPNITVNSGSICLGESFTLTPSGANTYTYSSGSNIVMPNTQTNYSVTGTDINGCISSVAISSVSINPLPILTVNSGTICSGNSFTIVPFGANTYSYSSGSNIVNPTTNATYSITGADINGCENTIATNVIVNTTPTITANSGTICAGNSFTIIPIGANTYSYSGGSSVVSPTADATYTVTGTSINGCISNEAISSIIVSPLPIITVNNGTICVGNSFTLVPAGGNNYTYSGGFDVVNPSSNTSYTVTGTDILTGCSNNVVSSITVNVLPIITVNSGTICAGESFTIIPNGASIYSYSGGSDVVSPPSNASFTVTGTDVNGCDNTAISSVTVNALPPVMATTNNTLLCTGQTATLSATGAMSYTWSTNETTTDIAVNPTVTTIYAVNGIDENGCSNTYTVSQNVDLCTGVIESRVFEGLKIYPNPTNGLFTIDIPSLSEIFITNVLGEIILNEKLISGKHYLDIQSQPAGVYFVKVVSKDEEQTTKIIKE